MQFAEVATEIEAARLLCYNAARMKEQGVNFTKQAAMAKWYSSVIAQKAAGSAIEWAGGLGYTRETGIERYWRDSKSELSFSRFVSSTVSDFFVRCLVGALYEGTSNIQLITIGKFFLHLDNHPSRADISLLPFSAGKFLSKEYGNQ